jgi:hypothetical protein
MKARIGKEVGLCSGSQPADQRLLERRVEVVGDVHLARVLLDRYLLVANKSRDIDRRAASPVLEINFFTGRKLDRSNHDFVLRHLSYS